MHAVDVAPPSAPDTPAHSATGNARLFADQTYHFQALRVLTDVAGGGADVAEVLETIARIPEGNASAWHDAFSDLGLRTVERARACRDRLSAGLAWLRAHTYFRTAEFLLKPDDPRRAPAWTLHVGAFDEAMDRLQVPHTRFTVPYDGGELRCIFYPGAADWARRPLIMFVGGYDSTLEELYLVLAKAAQERGYAVLTYEGPGQGAALREHGLVFTHEYEKPNRAVLDAFLAASPVAPSSVVLVGMSMGGYLAPRAAAFDERIDGVVAFDVFFDMGEPARATMAASRNPATAHVPGVTWAIDNAMWTLGLSSPDEVAPAFAPYTLAGVAERIRCDVLLLAGEHDHFVPLHQLRDMADACTGARSVETVVYDRASGGAEHCQLGATTLWHETFFDWLVRKDFGARRA